MCSLEFELYQQFAFELMFACLVSTPTDFMRQPLGSSAVCLVIFIITLFILHYLLVCRNELLKQNTLAS